MNKVIPIMLFFISLFFISCEDDTDTGVKKSLILDKTEISISEKSTGIVNIKEGNGNYKIISKDASIADASISNGVITIIAKKEGKTILVVQDAKFQSVKIHVLVTEGIRTMKIRATNVNVGVNKSIEIKIIEKGSNDFRVTNTNKSIATAKVKNGKIIVSGIAKGNTTIKIEDKITNTAVTITVTVKDSVVLKVSKKDFIKYNGGEEVRVYNGTTENEDRRSKLIDIISGSNIYDVKVKEGTGSDLITAVIENGKIKIRSLSAFRIHGEATIILTDEGLKEKKEIKVRSILPLDVNKTSLSMNVSEDSEYITYVHYSSTCKTCTTDHIEIKPLDSDALKVNKGVYDLLKGFNVTGKKVGKTSIILSDGILDVTIDVNVLKNTLLPVETSEGIVVSKDQNLGLSIYDSMTLIVKGSGEYKTTYENNLINELSFKNGTLKLKAGAKTGSTKVTIVDTVSKDKITFTINIKEGEVFNCDEEGEFTYKITYKEAKHDNKKVGVKGKYAYNDKKTYDCEETITMKVGNIIDINLCGGNPDTRYEVYDQEGIKGNKRDVVKIFNSKVKKTTTSTITALSPGELVVYIRGYKKDKTRVNKFYRILVVK